MNEATIPTDKNTLPILSFTQIKLGDLTQTQRKITEFILNKPIVSAKRFISELAAQMVLKGASAMVWFYRRSGISVHHADRTALANELGGSSLYYSYRNIYLPERIQAGKRMLFKRAIQIFLINPLMLRGKSLFVLPCIIED